MSRHGLQIVKSLSCARGWQALTVCGFRKGSTDQGRRIRRKLAHTPDTAPGSDRKDRRARALRSVGSRPSVAQAFGKPCLEIVAGESTPSPLKDGLTDCITMHSQLSESPADGRLGYFREECSQ